MPELPEVETMKRGILGIIGGRVERINWLSCRLKPIVTTPSRQIFRRRAVGKTIGGVDRVGKRVVIRLDGGYSVVLEPRMTGLVLVSDPPDREHLRWCIDIVGSKTKKLWYWDRRGLGSVRLFSDTEFQVALGPEKLGPDALKVTARVLADRFSSSRRSIKVALLDQKSLAGIGNLYASEILHLACIHPATVCNRLRPHDWKNLHKALNQVLSDAIAHEGSTLSDGTYRNALNQAGNYQNYHRVYGRAGVRCIFCGKSKICRIVQAQRSTFFCPTCQRRR